MMMVMMLLWQDQSQPLEECMSAAWVWALGHLVYCQLKDFLRRIKRYKSWVVLRLKILMLTLEVEPHQQMRILHPLLRPQTITLGVQAFDAELQAYQESKRPSEAAWNREPSAEEMRWVQL